MALFKSITRLFTVLTVAYGMHSTVATAGNLAADDIRATLAGNSVTWNHQGLTQQQYFSDTGFTVYQDAAGNHETGVWSVTEDGLFCSNWQSRGWICYELAIENTNQLLWNGPVKTGFNDTEKVLYLSRLQRGNKTTYIMETEQEADAVISHASQLLVNDDSYDEPVEEITLSTADMTDQYQNGYYYYQ